MKNLILMTLVLAQNSFATCGVDKQIDYNKIYDYESCTTYGLCIMADSNPETGRYETYYGWHNDCSAKYDIAIETYKCLTTSGREYTDVDESRISNCKPL